MGKLFFYLLFFDRWIFSPNILLFDDSLYKIRNEIKKDEKNDDTSTTGILCHHLGPVLYELAEKLTEQKIQVLNQYCYGWESSYEEFYLMIFMMQNLSSSKIWIEKVFQHLE